MKSETDAARVHDDVTRVHDVANILDGLSTVLEDAGSPAGDGGLTSAIQLVHRALPQCEYASVTLLDEHQRPYTIAATHPTARELDEKQYALGAGPCVDAATRRSINRLGVHDAVQRWPEFVELTVREGIGGYLAAGLTLRDDSYGVLNLYTAAERVFDTLDEALIEVITKHVASAIDAARRYRTAQTLATQLQTALRTRPVIDYAIGVLMAQTPCGPERAFALLKQSSQDNNTKLRDIAAQIVGRYSADNTPDPSG